MYTFQVMSDFVICRNGGCGHLWFWEKWKILSQACSKGQVVCPCQILSGSDEPDPSYCKKCELAAMGVLGSDGSPQHFDRRWPSWILRNMKNSFAGLFLGSSSMSMPNFVWIRWTGSKLLQKIIVVRYKLPLSIFCNNLDPVHRIQTKFGMDILLDPRNKPAEEFFIFLKIQDGRRRSKICDASYFFNFFMESNFQHYFSLWRRQKSCGQVCFKNAEFCLVSKTVKYVFVRIF